MFRLMLVFDPLVVTTSEVVVVATAAVLELLLDVVGAGLPELLLDVVGAGVLELLLDVGGAGVLELLLDVVGAGVPELLLDVVGAFVLELLLDVVGAFVLELLLDVVEVAFVLRLATHDCTPTLPVPSVKFISRARPPGVSLQAVHAVAPRSHVSSSISASVFVPSPTNREVGAVEPALAFFKRRADMTPVFVASVPISPSGKIKSTTRTFPVFLSATKSAPSVDQAKPAGEDNCPVIAVPSAEPAMPLPNVRSTLPSEIRTNLS